jgi:ankyrin repeat protein
MMPNTLEETCIRILCGIPDAYQQDAYKMLQWLASSVRALTLEELTEVLAINDEAQILNPDSRLTDPRDIIELCAGLITVKATNAEDEPNATTLSEVTLAHGSAKEFLLSETIKERSVRSYSINEPENHACIAESCLTYLGCLDQKLFVDEDCERFPLVRYAAWNWPSHTLRSNQNLRVIERGAQFLKSRGHNFRNWASLYDIDYASKGLASPVYYASEAGLVATLIILLEGKDSIEELPSSNCGRGSPLLVASRNGHEEVVRALLSRGANVNANDKAHQTSLHIAARKGHEGIVRMLLDHGAAIDAKDEGGLTALERAASRRQEETVRILLGHGADVNEMDQDGSTLLHKAAHVGHEALVKILLDHGADVNAKNQNGRTVLQEAAIEGYKATAEILLKYGADVNPCEDLNGRYHHCGTDLAAAAAGGHEEVVRTLLDAGADPNAQCADAKKLAEDRWEGLRFAASNQGVSISTLLEDLGTDPDNPSGRTRTIALEAARKNGRRAIEQILLSAGAKPYLSEY